MLKVISRSTFDLQTVLQTLVNLRRGSAMPIRLSLLAKRRESSIVLKRTGFLANSWTYVRNIPIAAERGSAFGRALLEGRAVHIPDVKADPEYTLLEGQKIGRFSHGPRRPNAARGCPNRRAELDALGGAPVHRETDRVGVDFADQAAIAIENVRLFESVEARTRELARVAWKTCARHRIALFRRKSSLRLAS